MGHDFFVGNFPQFSVFCSNLSGNYLNNYDSIPALDWHFVLKSTECYDYDKWICEFTSKLYQQCSWLQFQQLAAADSHFAEQSLIPFVQLLLQCSQHPHINDILRMLEYFFDEFLLYHKSANTGEQKSIFKDKRAINMMLNICESLRVKNNWYLFIFIKIIELKLKNCSII